jgi:hypothetical protein
MMEKIKAYFETLEGLSTKVLTDSAEKLVRAEKRNVALLIAHIAEMSRRKAALACGYKNIFDYCVRRLNLSEGSVALRLQVANVSRRFPQLLVALAENRISLTVAGHLASHLREENVDKLLSDCTGMTKRAVEEYLVELRPKPVFNPSIRKRPSSKRDIEKARDEGHQEAAQEREQPKQPCPSRCVEETPSQRAPSSSPNLLDPARPDTFNFRFSADGNFKAKFERLAEVLGVENPLKNMAEIFERAVDISLEKKDPKKKLERRLQRESARNASSGKSYPKLRGGSGLGSEGKAEGFSGPSQPVDVVLSKPLYEGAFADVDVALAVSEHTEDKLGEFAGCSKDGDFTVFSASDTAIVSAESCLGAG